VPGKYDVLYKGKIANKFNEAMKIIGQGAVLVK
jgi:hypothetical protein